MDAHVYKCIKAGVYTHVYAHMHTAAGGLRIYNHKHAYARIHKVVYTRVCIRLRDPFLRARIHKLVYTRVSPKGPPLGP